MNVDRKRPTAEGRRVGKGYGSESTHANFSDQAPCLQPAHRLDPGVDNRTAVRQLVDLEPELVRVGDHIFDDGERVRIDADRVLHSYPPTQFIKENEIVLA